MFFGKHRTRDLLTAKMLVDATEGPTIKLHGTSNAAKTYRSTSRGSVNRTGLDSSGQGYYNPSPAKTIRKKKKNPTKGRSEDE